MIRRKLLKEFHTRKKKFEIYLHEIGNQKYYNILEYNRFLKIFWIQNSVFRNNNRFDFYSTNKLEDAIEYVQKNIRK